MLVLLVVDGCILCHKRGKVQNFLLKVYLAEYIFATITRKRNIVSLPTLNWGEEGLVIARREEEGAVLSRVAIYSVSGRSRVGAGSVATRRDLRLFGAVTGI